MNVELNQVELRLIAQSLSHCLDTCKHKGEAGAKACEDCDAARVLMQKVTGLAGAEGKKAGG